MYFSYRTLHPASHCTLIDIIDVWARPGTMCARCSLSGMPAISRLHVCVDLSFYLSGILMDIGLLYGYIFFSVVPFRKKIPVAPVSAMSFLFIPLLLM